MHPLRFISNIRFFMRKILAIVAIFGAQHAYSQTDFREAFIINNDGDTLTGFVDYREGSKNFKECEFKKSKDAEPISFSPDQIKGYRFINDKYFESNEIQTDKETEENVFLEVLVKGKVSLYKYSTKFYISKDTLFYQLKNEQKEVVIEGKRVVGNSNKHVGILSYMLSDCVGVQSNIESIRINEKELTKLVEKYNTCSGEPTITFKEKKPWLRINTGIVTGVGLSTIKFSSVIPGAEYLASNFDKDYSLTVGANFELNAPRLNERIAFYAGVYYLNSNYVSFNTQEQSLSIYRNDVVIKLKQLKIPFGIRYTLPERNVAPYINFGASTTLHLNTASEWTKETQQNNVVETFESEALEINKYQIGYWSGVGINKTINSRFTGNLEVRYELTNGISTKNDPAISGIQNIYILAGISF